MKVLGLLLILSSSSVFAKDLSYSFDLQMDTLRHETKSFDLRSEDEKEMDYEMAVTDDYQETGKIMKGRRYMNTTEFTR